MDELASERVVETGVQFDFLSFFLPILCSVNSDHDKRVGVWHISLQKKKKKKKKKKRILVPD